MPSRTERTATRSNRLSRCSSAASTELSTTSVENTFIGTSRSLIFDGMRAKLMTANDWRVRFEARKVSGSDIANQSRPCPKALCKGHHFKSGEPAQAVKPQAGDRTEIRAACLSLAWGGR